jgi:hypothetical protein
LPELARKKKINNYKEIQKQTKKGKNFMRDDIKKYIEEEVESIDSAEFFDQFLDDTNEAVVVMGLTYQPSDVLKEVDPTAYRCGKNDYIDAVLTDGDYIEIDEKLYLKNKCIDLWFDRLESFRDDLIKCIETIDRSMFEDVDDIDDLNSIDVRFGVINDQFIFRSGHPDYDQDSLAVSSSSVTAHSTAADIAEDLIEQTKDFLLQEIGGY